MNRESQVERKKNPFSLAIGISLVVIGLFLLYGAIDSLSDNTSKMYAPGGIITIEKADTVELQSIGLSGRDSLANDQGLLFDYAEVSEEHCLWMKDMNFAIDMIWMNENKEVIHIVKNVSPDTYPNSYCPDEPAKFSLELNAGNSENLKIEEGVKLNF